MALASASVLGAETTAPLAPASNPCLPWPATDALGRSLPLADEVGPVKSGRFAGIFYFLWLNERDNKRPQGDGPYDVAKILAEDSDALKKPKSPLWGTIARSHYWAEPLYGYYLSNDPWVLRRHAQLLSDAGVDTLIFDTTNALTYRDIYFKLCEVFQLIGREGGRVPQIAFMVNTEAGKTAQKLFDEFYKPGLFPELWFQWQGKPLLLCDPAQAPDEVKQFFTLRRAHWPFEMVNTSNAWHWEAAFPQPYGFTEDPAKPEQVNVSVAQNLRQKDGKVTNMSNGDARGRSFHDGKLDVSPDAVLHGYNVQEQWNRALELAPPFVMVTGWNEWIAGRWGTPDGPIVFVDQFSQEFSRDIEPMKGGHGDNYYWQLAANLRRFKGVPPVPGASDPKTIPIGGGFDSWRDVRPDYLDHLGETQPRDFDGAGGLHYTNNSGRNDLAVCKVARDNENIYFYIRTRENLAQPGTNWMWLMIDADRNPKTGWEGYDFIVNRQSSSEGKAVLEKNTGGWQWEKTADIVLQFKGNELQLAIPRKTLRLAPDGGPVSFDFKWADNLQHPGDPMDFFLSGDVAPEGRFKFRYTAP